MSPRLSFATSAPVRTVRTPGAFFADYAGLASWPVTRRELRAIAVPAIVTTRPSAPPHVDQAADALAALLPHVRRDHAGDLSAATRALLLD